MRASEVLDHQAALGDYLDSRYYHGYLHRFLTDMQRKNKIETSITGQQMCGTLARSLRVANAFHVQAEMMPVLRAASVDLDDEDYLVHSRLPAEHGWLMFEEPWITRDVWDEQMAVHALQWRHGSAQMGTAKGSGTVTVPGIWITSYTDIEDPRDEVNARLIEEHGVDTLRLAGRWHVNHLWFLGYQETVGEVTQLIPEEYAAFAVTGRPPAASHLNPNRMVVALFRLLSQVFVEVKDHPLDRSALRRAKRANLPQRVQVITLRRKETKFLYPAEGASHVEWQHSWVVRGHWAWRHCGAEHPEAEAYGHGHRARVYIRPHVKGDPDKPLLLTSKVWSLER